MATTTSTHDDTQRAGTFLGGWGGVVAVVLGLVLAVALSPLMNVFVPVLHSALVTLGMSPATATLAFYWAGMVASGIGFIIAFAGWDTRMDRLRGGEGTWPTLLAESLVVAGISLFWVFAGATWTNYVAEFNAYEATIELPAVGLLAAMIVSAVLIRRWRRRRFSETRRDAGQAYRAHGAR